MKHDEIFERLEPPPGGLAKLRDRLAARPGLVRRLAPPLVLAAAIAAVVLFLIGRQRPMDPVAEARLHGNGAEVVLGLAPMPNVPVTIDEESRTTTALVKVPTQDPKVAFYWVSSTEWKD